MTAAEFATRAQASASRVGRWALRRARERSTWAGLSMLAAALGRHALSAQLGQVGDAITVLVGASGVAIAAATTSQHPPAV